jgi:DNA-directed RNA polymerase subunit RPC12/RpoP
MTIPAKCPKCGHTGNAPEKAVGKRIRCPECRSTFLFEVFTDTSKKPFDTAYDREKWWQPRINALEKILGPQGDTDIHALIFFDMGAELGGAPDVHTFPRHKKGVVAYVTAELIGRENQLPNEQGNYEILICLPKGVDAEVAGTILTPLAYYTLEQPLNPGDTSDLGELVEGSKVTALMFSDYGRFTVLKRQCGLLLCMGITQREVKYAAKHSAGALEQELRDAGVYPVTDFARKSVV